MINFIIGFIVFGLMIYSAYRIVKKLRVESGICGMSCSGCASSCKSKLNEQKNSVD